MDLPCLLGLGNQTDANSIFHTGAWVEALEFRQHGRLAAIHNFVELHQRCSSNQFGYVFCDFHYLESPSKWLDALCTFVSFVASCSPRRSPGYTKENDNP